jgi:hypothetical protein
MSADAHGFLLVEKEAAAYGRRIVALEQTKREAKLAANSNLQNAAKPAVPLKPDSVVKATNTPVAQLAGASPAATRAGHWWWAILLALAVLAAGVVICRLRSKSST